MPSQPEILAAGAVVARRKAKQTEVLLVHRPKYDDWSFPKGKLDTGEHVVTAAVREVAEETGIDIRLGPPLRDQTYPVDNGSRRTKRVKYWVGRVVAGDVADYRPNDEVDEVAWVPLDKARKRLTYGYDVVTLEEFAEQYPRKTHPLVVLRHSRARSRKSWRGDDRERTLTKAGEFQSEQMVPLLSAYGVERVVSSTSRRCWTTVAPYAEVAGLDVEVTDALSEQDATATVVASEVRQLLDARQPAVLCTHRPVLPWVFGALGLEERTLEPGALFIAHHRRGTVVSVEHHDVSFR